MLIKLTTRSCLEIRTQNDFTGECRKLHNGVLNDLHSSTNFIPLSKSRRMRWARHVARMGEDKKGVQVLSWATWGKEFIRKNQAKDARIILRRIFKWDEGEWTRLVWLRLGTGGGHLRARQWTFRFHKMRGISENQLASQERLCPMDEVS